MTDILREQALRLLARRDHSRAELARKLAASGEAGDIAALLDQFERSGLLSDARMAENFVAARRARCGPRKLRHDLRARGLDDALIDSALAAERADEIERARVLWRQRFGAPARDAREYARQYRYLVGRGFDAEAVRRVLREPVE